MSDWYTESKKPIPGKIGKLIEKSRKDNVLVTSKMISESKRIAEMCENNVSNDLILNEIEKLGDFANGWADDQKYLKYDKKSIHYTQVKVNGFFDLELTNREEIQIWTKGYHQAVHDLYDRITKLELLYRVHLLQNTKSNLGKAEKNHEC